jgi:hypothetical protein
LLIFLFFRWEYNYGLKRLITFGQKYQGYKKDYQLKIAELCTHALDVFEYDYEIVTLALLVAGYTLISKNPKKVRVHFIKDGIVEYCDGLMKEGNQRTNPRIIGAISWLRSKLPSNIGPVPVVIHKDDNKAELFEKEEVNEEQQETDEAIIRALNKVTL